MLKGRGGADLASHYAATVMRRVEVHILLDVSMSYGNKRSDHRVRFTWRCTEVNLGFKETTYWRKGCITCLAGNHLLCSKLAFFHMEL